MKAKKGFTLVEILIVVVILGILAAIVIPQFSDASTEAKESAAKSDLSALRSQLELYKIRTGPGYPASLAALQAAGYIQQVPTDPWGTAYSYTAATGAVATTYDANF